MIQKLEQGPIGTNTYVVTKDNDCVVIDPTGNVNKILNAIKDKNVLAILLTHGHWDHIQQVDAIKERYNCPIYLHKEDLEITKNNDCEKMFGFKSIIKSIVNFYDNNTLLFNDMKFDIYHTPGHTLGSIIIKYENNLFTGDTLFKESIGRIDFEESDRKSMIESLKYIKTFDPIYDIYPGHGETSTLKYEFENNPYLK